MLRLMKNTIGILALFMMISMSLMSMSKVEEPAVIADEVETVVVDETVIINEDGLVLMEDCSTTGTDSLTTIKNYSLYREFFKQDNYDQAIGSWRKVYFDAPGIREQMHADGIKMMKHFIKLEKDAAHKEGLIDTLMFVYDQRIHCFASKNGTEGSVLARKMFDMSKYRGSDTKGVYEAGARTIELEGNSTKYFVLGAFMTAAVKMEEAGDISPEQVLAHLDDVTNIIDTNAQASNGTKFTDAKPYIQGICQKYFSCELLIPRMQVDYDNAPNDIDNLKIIQAKLYGRGCKESPLYQTVAGKIFEIAPTFESAEVKAKQAYQAGDYAETERMYEKAISLGASEEQKSDIYYKIAIMHRSKTNDFGKAREYCNKAIAARPGWGEPYLLIGDMYASSGRRCGPGTGWDSQVVAWAAIDKYQKAKQVDPSIAEKAQDKINRYWAFMPLKQDIFFKNLKVGQSYRVGCWIQESTTIRSRD